MRRRRGSQKGFALVLTLVVTALLVGVAAEFIHGVYVETSLHRNYLNLQQAGLMAESGVSGGIALVRGLRTAGNGAPLLQVLAKPQELEDEKGQVSITIEEEEGKLNLNDVSRPTDVHEIFHPMTQRLLRLLTLPVGAADALADWVDVNDDPRPDGAESAYYQALPSPSLPRNGRAKTFGELGLVRWLNPAVVQRLRPYATVYGDREAINVNTAPKEVLMALHEDMSEAMANAIIDRRRESPIANFGELSGIPGMQRIANDLGTRVTYTGSTYRLISRATVGEAVRVVEAVVNIDGIQPKYLYWREY